MLSETYVCSLTTTPVKATSLKAIVTFQQMKSCPSILVHATILLSEIITLMFSMKCLVSFLPRGLQFQNYLHVDLVFEFPHIRISKVSHKTLTCLLILFEALNCCIFTFHCAYLELIMPYSSQS